MSVKATENYVPHLIMKVVNAANTVILKPTVTLQSIRIYLPSQIDVLSSSSENCFESLLKYMDMTESELDILLAESEEDKLLSNPIDCIVQAINSIHFDEPQCPILRL